MVKKLSELKNNECGKIISVEGDTHLKRRLLELGLTKGTYVKVLCISALRNSFLLSLRDYTLALRKNSLELVSVVI